MAFLIGGANSAAADASYTVDNSCRWDRASSPEMNKTLSDGDRQKWTISWWMKPKPPSGVDYNIFKIWTSSSTKLNCRLPDGGTFSINGEISDSVGFNLITNAVYRDPSAWYHFVFAVDTTQAVAANRMKLYVNGSQVTSFSTETYPAEDYNCGINVASDVFYWGVAQNSTNFFDGYFAEVVFIDGTQYAASDFGEYDEDSPTIWKPKDVSALTFGTNGFYLDFEASGNLGNDANGGTDLGETNLAAADQATDTPTNNFCTMNPLDNFYQGHTFSEGNLKIVTQANNTYTFSSGTFGLSSGKWYAECKLAASGGYADIGIANKVSSAKTDSLGGTANGGYAKHDFSSNVTALGSGVANGSALSVGNICGVFVDLDNNKIYFSINGSLQNTTGIGITAAASTTNGNYFFCGGDEDGGSAVTLEWNFGGCSSFSLSSAVNDDNGYGNFEYTPTVTVESTETKFYAVCTKNLAEYG